MTPCSILLCSLVVDGRSGHGRKKYISHHITQGDSQISRESQKGYVFARREDNAINSIAAEPHHSERERNREHILTGLASIGWLRSEKSIALSSRLCENAAILALSRRLGVSPRGMCEMIFLRPCPNKPSTTSGQNSKKVKNRGIARSL